MPDSDSDPWEIAPAPTQRAGSDIFVHCLPVPRVCFEVSSDRMLFDPNQIDHLQAY
jgi:hypothetical protein